MNELKTLERELKAVDRSIEHWEWNWKTFRSAEELNHKITHLDKDNGIIELSNDKKVFYKVKSCDCCKSYFGELCRNCPLKKYSRGCDFSSPWNEFSNSISYLSNNYYILKNIVDAAYNIVKDLKNVKMIIIEKIEKTKIDKVKVNIDMNEAWVKTWGSKPINNSIDSITFYKFDNLDDFVEWGKHKNIIALDENIGQNNYDFKIISKHKELVKFRYTDGVDGEIDEDDIKDTYYAEFKGEM